jgi:hypothetical protein
MSLFTLGLGTPATLAAANRGSVFTFSPNILFKTFTHRVAFDGAV